MHELMGILWICGACALFVQYKPKSDENRMLCGLMAVMGLVALIAGQGNLLFTVVQLVLELTVGACCALRVRAEYLCRRRRQRKLHALRRAQMCAKPVPRAG